MSKKEQAKGTKPKDWKNGKFKRNHRGKYRAGKCRWKERTTKESWSEVAGFSAMTSEETRKNLCSANKKILSSAVFSLEGF